MELFHVKVSYSYAFHTKQYLVHQHTNFWTSDIVGNWDSSVSIVTRQQAVSLRNCYWMSINDKRFISPSLCLTGSGIHSISYSAVTAVASMGLKHLWYEADRSLPSGAEVESECSFTDTVWYGFVVQTVNCTFTLCYILRHSKLVKWQYFWLVLVGAAFVSQPTNQLF